MSDNYNNGSEETRNSGASTSGFSVTENITGDPNMVNTATDWVNLIKEIAKNVVESYAPKAYTAQVMSRVDDNHYNLRIISTQSQTIVHNITNQTPYALQIGDYVEVLDTQNNLSTSYITAKIMVPAANTISTSTYATNNFTTSEPCYLRYTGSRWWLIFSDDFYNNTIIPLFKEVPVYDANNHILGVRKQAVIKIGVARKSSKVNHGEGRGGRTHPGEGWDTKLSNFNTPSVVQRRSRYTYPEYIGKFIGICDQQVSVGVVRPIYIIDQIRTVDYIILDAKTCDATPVPAIDITEIVNNSIFMDDTVYRRSTKNRLNTQTDWFKEFGIFIKKLDGTDLYITPENDLYKVVVSKENCQKYNINNITWFGARKEIKLSGVIGAPYEVNEAYITHNYSGTTLLVPVPNTGNTEYQRFITGSPEHALFRVITLSDKPFLATHSGEVLTTVNHEDITTL